MKKLIVAILSMVFSVSCLFSVVFAQAEEQTVTFNCAIIEKTVTTVLHTGEDLCLPLVTAKQGDEDVTGQVTVSVYNEQNQKVNAEGSFIAENLPAGTYTVIYSVGEASTDAYTVVVKDDAPSAVLEEDRRPASVAYREVAYRVRAIVVDEGATVMVYLYDANGNEVYAEEQKASTRQISLTPSVLGYNTVTYKITSGGQTVLCSFPVFVEIKDYEGDFFGYTFEGDDWIDAYNIGVWCNTDNNSDALVAGITREESRSGGASLKFDVVSLQYQPTIYFSLDFTPDRLMRKDDVTEYVIRLYVKKGEDFTYDDLLPVVDFHALAKKSTTDSHYGAYKWSLGNFLIKPVDEDGWALVEYTFVSYSDEYVFSQDWLGAAPNYTNYGGIQFAIVPTNYTGTIYIDDIQLFKKGVEVEDLLASNPHIDGTVDSGDQSSEGNEPSTGSKGCSGMASSTSVISFAIISAFGLLLKRRNLK